MLYFFRAYVVTYLLYSALICSVHFHCFRQFSIKYPKNVINDNLNLTVQDPLVLQDGPRKETRENQVQRWVSLSSSFQNLAKDLFRYLASTTFDYITCRHETFSEYWRLDASSTKLSFLHSSSRQWNTSRVNEWMHAQWTAPLKARSTSSDSSVFSR